MRIEVERSDVLRLVDSSVDLKIPKTVPGESRFFTLALQHVGGFDLCFQQLSGEFVALFRTQVLPLQLGCKKPDVDEYKARKKCTDQLHGVTPVRVFAMVSVAIMHW